MNKDLTVAGHVIALIIGLGLVKGQTKRELQIIGQVITGITILSAVRNLAT